MAEAAKKHAESAIKGGITSEYVAESAIRGGISSEKQAESAIKGSISSQAELNQQNVAKLQENKAKCR